MFASRTTKDIEVPGGHVTIRRLSYLQLEAAERATRKRAILALTELQAATAQMDSVAQVIAEAIKRREAGAAAADTAAGTGPATAAGPPDALDDYDQRTVLISGLVSVTLGGKTDKFTDAMADDLDEEVAPMLAREILRLTKPALFETPDVAEAAEKNG